MTQYTHYSIVIWYGDGDTRQFYLVEHYVDENYQPVDTDGVILGKYPNRALALTAMNLFKEAQKEREG